MKLALDIFRALADETRLRIVALLASMELSVGELAQVLGQSQPRVSRHIKILVDAGLAERRKEGSWVFVALGADALVAPVIAALTAWGADAETQADVARLEAVRADRAAAAAAWFQAHAGEWDAIRSLHVAEEQVEAAMLDVLGGAPLGRLVDIGTGTGRMIELFAPRAVHALGIDKSSEMLRLADAAADVAILHHVLHFAQQPGAAIAEAARVLDAGGRLLNADVASHDREDLRARDAHTRLGFSDAQIDGWFTAAGLMPARIETLEGGELTVKLWLGRKIGEPVREAKAA